MAYNFGVPPPNYTRFYDSSSPYSSGEYVHYVPYDGTTPQKTHTRKPSHNPSPREGGWYAPADMPSYYDANVQYATPRKNVYVSTGSGKASKYQTTNYATPRYETTTRTPRKSDPPPIRVYDDGMGRGDARAKYVYREPRTPTKHAKKPSADTYFYFNQEQIYNEQPKRTPTHVRNKSNTSTKSPQKPKTTSTRPRSAAHAVATEEDAIRAKIPKGYSYKNWDPSEKPIILLGSVFDANSLGKWIYDWTVCHHGASTPMADMAGDLWLLLIKLAGKMKKAEETMSRIRNQECYEMVEDFVVSGQRLWDKFKSLLKDCEYYMMKAAKKDGAKTMGKNAGTEFVDSIFGRDRYLEHTEKIMNNVRLWNMRFDVNCEDILRRPGAA